MGLFTRRRTEPTGRPDEVSPAEAAALVESGALLLDVREGYEWTAGHAPGATHVPLSDVALADLPRDRVVVAVCRSGNRSGQVTNALRATGLDVRNLVGGMKAWAAEGRPVITDDGGPGGVA